MTAALVVSMFVSTVTLVLCVLLTLQFRRTLDSAFHHAERLHERSAKALEGVLDRFMALDFAQFKSWQSTEGAEFGGFEAPEAMPAESDLIGRIERPGSWGHVSALRDRFENTELEESLLAEDFPDEPTEVA